MNTPKRNAEKFLAKPSLPPPNAPFERLTVATIRSKDLLTILTRRTTTINTTAETIRNAAKLDSRDTAFAIFIDSFNAVCKFAAHDAKERGEPYTQGQFRGVPKGYEKKLADDVIKVMFLGSTLNLAVAEAVIDKLCYGAEETHKFIKENIIRRTGEKYYTLEEE
jgi:hypothetical protein